MFVSISEQGAYVRKNGERLVVEKDGQVLSSIHIHDIEGLQLFGNIQLTTHLMQKLMTEGVAVHYLSRSGYLYGEVIGEQQKQYAAKKSQLEALKDEDLQHALAIHTVQMKIRGQLATLKVRRSQINRQIIQDNAHQLQILIRKCEDTETLAQLIGLEGIAAKYYFQAFDKLLPEDFPFEKRSRRPAHNEMNSLMNYSYSLLQSTVLRACTQFGFDGYLGFLHQERYGRMNLVFDIMELFRPIVDRQLIQWVRQRVIKTNDFERVAHSFQLCDTSRKKFLAVWRKWEDDIGISECLYDVLDGLKKSYTSKDVTPYAASCEKALRHLL